MYRTAMVGFALLMGSAQAEFVPTGSAPSMEKMLSYSAMAGLKLAAKSDTGDTEEDRAIKNCIQKLDDSAFHDVIEAFLTRRFSKAELASMEKFMSSPAGKKYAKNRILAGHALVGEAQPEPLAELTPDDVKVIEQFHSTSLGKRLVSVNGLWDDAAEKAIKARGNELFEGCLPK